MWKLCVKTVENLRDFQLKYVSKQVKSIFEESPGRRSHLDIYSEVKLHVIIGEKE